MSSIVLYRSEAPTPGVPPSKKQLLSAGLDHDESRLLRRLIFYGFALRAVLAVALDWSGYSLRLAPDEETYAVNGWQMALYWTGELLLKPWWVTSPQPLGYFYINAAFFYIFGNTQIPLKLINGLVGAYSVRYVYLLSRDLFGTGVARRAAILFEFLPSLILWSALNIRDVWVIYLILLVSWKSLQVVRGYSHLGLVTGIGAALLLALFRDYLFYVVALPPLAALLIGRSDRLGRNFVLALVGGLVLLMLVQHSGVGEGAATRMSLEAISKVRQDMATGGSAFHENVDISTPGRAIAFLPIGVAYFLFSPFPWQITSVLKALSVPEMVLIYFLTPAMLRGIQHTIRVRLRESLQVVLLTTLLTVSYALGEGNVGTLYRHRAQAIAFYLIFASVGVEISRSRAVQQAGA